MAVIESSLEVCIAAYRQIEARRSEGREPTKVLMSQRQLDAFDHSLRIQGGIWEHKLYDLPIIICPDCDLYVP